jgi:hypothetical protein
MDVQSINALAMTTPLRGLRYTRCPAWGADTDRPKIVRQAVVADRFPFNPSRSRAADMRGS